MAPANALPTNPLRVRSSMSMFVSDIAAAALNDFVSSSETFTSPISSLNTPHFMRLPGVLYRVLNCLARGSVNGSAVVVSLVLVVVSGLAKVTTSRSRSDLVPKRDVSELETRMCRRWVGAMVRQNAFALAGITRAATKPIAANVVTPGKCAPQSGTATGDQGEDEDLVTCAARNRQKLRTKFRKKVTLDASSEGTTSCLLKLSTQLVHPFQDCLNHP